MPDDEQAIRDVISTWIDASAKGDLPTILTLMSNDVIFLITGQAPMRGRDAFAAAFPKSADYRVEGDSKIQEIQVAGDMAYAWTHLTVTITPIDGGPPRRRSGHTLSIFRKTSEGAWVLSRDANMLTAESL